MRRTIKSLQGTRALTTKAWLWGKGGRGGGGGVGPGGHGGPFGGYVLSNKCASTIEVCFYYVRPTHEATVCMTCLSGGLLHLLFVASRNRMRTRKKHTSSRICTTCVPLRKPVSSQHSMRQAMPSRRTNHTHTIRNHVLLHAMLCSTFAKQHTFACSQFVCIHGISFVFNILLSLCGI